ARREPAAGQRAAYLAQAVPEMPAREPPQPRVAGRVEHVAGFDRGPPVALPGQGEHRVRSGVDTAVDHPGQVHAEERELRIRYRVDQPTDQVAAVGTQFVVLATERDDPRRRVDAGQP